MEWSAAHVHNLKGRFYRANWLNRKYLWILTDSRPGGPVLGKAEVVRDPDLGGHLVPLELGLADHLGRGGSGGLDLVGGVRRVSAALQDVLRQDLRLDF